MSNRIDNGRETSRLIERQIQTRAKETQKKQGQEFQQKLMTETQQGANAKQSELSKQVLEQYAKASGEEDAPQTSMLDDLKSSQEEASPTLLKQQQAKKTQKHEDTKQAHQDKHVQKKNEQVALETAVQRKRQQDQDSGEMGGSGGGDFFQQAVSMGMAVQQSAATEAHPVQIPEKTLNEIVDKVFVGLDPAGNSKFVIEFKAGVLNGGQLEVSSQGRGVKLKFNGLDASSRQSLKMASSDLKSKLEGKGLKLEQFEV